MKVSRTTWVVTGAGSGIGRELALQLLAMDARVAAVDRDVAGLERLETDAGAGVRLSVHPLDITSREAVAALPADVEDAHGPVDGLVNNAGIIQPFLPLADLDDATIERVLDVNLMGTLHMVRAFLPRLVNRPRAHVVNVSSMGGFFPFPGQTVYGASKAAVKLLTEGLYVELLDSPVRVTAVFPGAVDTAIAENSGVTVPQAAAGARVPTTSAGKAARVIIKAIEADRLHVYVGPDAKAMNLAIKLAPGPAIRFVKRQMSRMLTSPQTVDRAGRDART